MVDGVLMDRIRMLAEAVIDELNRGSEADPDYSPIMLSSYVLLVEGNGWTADGQCLTRGFRDFHGSASQVKGLLVDTLDDLRGQDPET